jgi:hypothetical protein
MLTSSRSEATKSDVKYEGPSFLTVSVRVFTFLPSLTGKVNSKVVGTALKSLIR